MANYQQYQKYKRTPENKGFRLGKILLILAIVFVAYLIGRSIFSSPAEVESNLPIDNSLANEIEVADEGEQININGEADSNSNSSNSNTNENENSNVNIDLEVSATFSVDDCSRVYSRGSADEKKVSLTFNVGTAKEGEIQKVLDALSDGGVPADFFVRGDVAEENPDLINKISSAGFSVYNLSYGHPHFNDLPESGMSEQLAKAETAISGRTGKTTKPFFRPPYGEADEDVIAAVTAAGYCPITWTVDALDWLSEYSAAQSKQRVLDNIGNGAIVLMQAGNSITAQIVPELITELQNQGYEIVSLDNILQ